MTNPNWKLEPHPYGVAIVECSDKPGPAIAVFYGPNAKKNAQRVMAALGNGGAV